MAGSEGALKIKMVNTGSKVYAAAGCKLLVIDPTSVRRHENNRPAGYLFGHRAGQRRQHLVVLRQARVPDGLQILTATDGIGVKNEVKDINLSGGWVPSYRPLRFENRRRASITGKTRSADRSHYDYPIYKHDCADRAKTEKFISLSETAERRQLPDIRRHGRTFRSPTSFGQNSIKGYGTDYLTNSIHSFSNQGKLVKTYSDKTAFPAGVFFKTE